MPKYTFVILPTPFTLLHDTSSSVNRYHKRTRSVNDLTSRCVSESDVVHVLRLVNALASAILYETHCSNRARRCLHVLNHYACIFCSQSTTAFSNGPYIGHIGLSARTLRFCLSMHRARSNTVLDGLRLIYVSLYEFHFLA